MITYIVIDAACISLCIYTNVYLFFECEGRQKEQADANLIISEEEPATVEKPASKPTEKLSRGEHRDLCA